jgi:hypothetical protein
LSPEDQLAGTRNLAAEILGMPEDQARSIVTAAGRQWADITGATWLTADLRLRRVRVRVVDGLVRDADAG